MKSDVSHDICVEPDQLLVVVSKVAVEPLGLPGVALRDLRLAAHPSLHGLLIRIRFRRWRLIRICCLDRS